jgi:hypothetical protein
MKKNIENRVKKIEQALSIGEEQTIVVMLIERYGDKPVEETFGPIEQWASYKQYIEFHKEKSFIVFNSNPQLEIIARQRPLTTEELAVLGKSKYSCCG